MPNTQYTPLTHEAKTLIEALRCPDESPWRKLGLDIVRRALTEPTKRAAAAVLGMHETKLSALLKRHPELRR